jgi:hypothetical protein
MGEHISMDQAWILIQEGSLLDDAVAKHLHLCSDCREFLRSFVSVARYVGYSTRFPDLDHDSDWERAA